MKKNKNRYSLQPQTDPENTAPAERQDSRPEESQKRFALVGFPALTLEGVQINQGDTITPEVYDRIPQQYRYAFMTVGIKLPPEQFLRLPRHLQKHFRMDQ